MPGFFSVTLAHLFAVTVFYQSMKAINPRSHVCSTSDYYTTTYYTSLTTRWTYTRYYTSCGFLWLSRCTRYVRNRRYTYVQKSRAKKEKRYHCCPGWRSASGGQYCSIPKYALKERVQEQSSSSTPLQTGISYKVGNMFTEFKVVQGQANYKVPVPTPKGFPTHLLEMDLVYNSGVGNGPLGLGWTINGLSQISRCPLTYAQDGKRLGIKYNSGDRYCLDGFRLVLESGEYGRQGSTYGTELDTFLRAYAQGTLGSGPQSFLVKTKNNQKRSFGTQVDSRVKSYRQTSVHAWKLDSISDYSNNVVNITYMPNTNGLLVSRITYSNMVIAFEYEARRDVSTPYFNGGVLFTQNKRLRLIKTVVNGRLHRQIQLTYIETKIPKISLVSSVQLCSRGSNCYKPEKLVFQGIGDVEPANSPTSWTKEFSASSGDSRVRDIIDMNDDGLGDIVEITSRGVKVALNQNGRFEPAKSWLTWNGGISKNRNNKYQRFVKDLNGDHLPDIVDFGKNGVYVSLNSGSESFTAPTRWSGQSGSTIFGTRFVKDMNGDELPDIICFEDSGVYVALGTSSTFMSAASWTTQSGYPVDGLTAQKHQRYLEDVNGDGLPDVVVIANSGSVYVAINTGSSLVAVSIWGSGIFGYNQGWRASSHPKYIVDVNNDGLADIIEFSCCGVEVSLSTGTRFLPRKRWITAFGYNHGWKYNGYPRYIHDVNGDGLPDVVGFASGLVLVSLNTGSAFAAVETWIANDDTNQGGRSVSQHPPFLVDVTGDGMSDVVEFRSTGVYISTNKNQKPLITSITDSYANTHRITYSSLADRTIYTRGATTQYPDPKVNIAQTVVKQFIQNNGIGGFNTTNFIYKGMRVNLKGRGNLGFSEVSEHLQESNESTTSRYFQIFPLTALTQSAVSKKVGNKVILQRNKAYSVTGGYRKQIQLTSDESHTYEPNGKHVQSERLLFSEVDTYGNIQTMKIIRSGNGKRFEQISKSNFSNNLHTWYIGGLDTIAVTYRTGGVSSTRMSTFYYNRNTRKLLYEMREPEHYLGLNMSYVYDNNGNVIEKTEIPIFTRFASDSPHKVFRNYDTQGIRLMSKRNGLGHVESYTYDHFGNMVKFTDINGLVTHYTYDAFDRKTSESRPDGTIIRMEIGFSQSGYGVWSERIVQTGKQDTFTMYDSLDRPIKVVSTGYGGEKIHEDIVYDSLGRVQKQSLPYFFKDRNPTWVIYEYDELGRDISQKHPFENTTATTRTVYKGLVREITDANGNLKRIEKDARGKIVRITDAMGGTVAYKYDTVGNLIKTTDPAGHVTTMTYDKLGNKISMNDPDMGLWNYLHDAHGQMVWQRDAVGNEVFFTYDKLGRMVQRKAPEGKTKWIYDTSTNGKGKLARAVSPSGHVMEYTYDSKGREAAVRQKIGKEVFSVHSEYNPLGQISRQILPGNKIVNYCYDNQGFTTKVTQSSCGQGFSGNGYWRALEYDAFGHIAKEEYANSLLTEYQYDDSNHIKSIKTRDPSMHVKRHWEYSFDAVGNMLERKDLNDAWNTVERFSFDRLDRITRSNIRKLHSNKKSAFTEDWEYDSVGNIRRYSGLGGLRYQYSHKHPHAVIKAGPNTYAYDANGNMIRKNQQRVTWTSFNKPRTMERMSGGTVRFEYDHAQNRYEKTSPEETKIYIGKVYEKTTSGQKTMHKYFIYALGKLVAIETKTDERSPVSSVNYIHGDHLDSVDTVTNQRGEIVELLRYNAYGKRRASTWASFNLRTSNSQPGSIYTKRGFTGHEHLEELDLIHMNGRIYDPVVGRFLSPDPHVQDPYNTQTFNRYSYTLNNPLKHKDPTGFFFMLVLGIFAAVVTTAVTYPLAAGLVASVGLSGMAATITTGVITGAASGFAGGAVSTQSVEGGLRGALGGAISGGIGGYFGSTWNLERVAAQAIGGGTATELGGGEFKDGFLMAAATGSAQYLYNTAVQYGPTWKPGGLAQLKSYTDMPIRGANNIGTQGETIDPSGWLNEGGKVSRFLNLLPGVNAISGFHDFMQINMDGAARDVLNVPNMVPATLITYAALIDGPASQALLVEKKKRRGRTIYGR